MDERRREPWLTPGDRERIARAWAWSTSVTRVPATSIHGPVHWRRVACLGLRLARLEGADLLVVALFAACHDVARVHDGKDLEHGPRAARWVRRDLAADLDLEPRRLERLLRAIRGHTAGRTSGDRTIGCCWDGDRLDLVRIGFPVNPDLMSTESAVTREMIDRAARLWARDRRRRIEAGLPVPVLRRP